MRRQFSAVEELDAMKSVAQALSKLDEPAIRRVLRWANDAFFAQEWERQ